MEKFVYEEEEQEFINICRFCSNSHDILKPIFQDKDENEIVSNNTNITKIAEILLGITMNISDELPKFICAICFDKLVSSYEFRQNCLLSIKNLEEKLSDNRQKQMQIIECQEYKINNELVYLYENVYDTQRTIKQEIEIDEEKEYDYDIDFNNENFQINNLRPEIKPKTATISKGKKTLKNNKKSDKKNERTICSICGESFKLILRHIRTVHTIRERYECEFCGKMLKEKAHLKHHFRIHLNDRKYKCKFCDKTSVDASTIRIHMLHHNDAKNFKCNLCGKSFKRKDSLRMHVKIHTQERNFFCVFCNQPFLTKQLKKRHEVLHTNECPFKCEFCTNSFKSSGALSLHRYKAHTKLNPYKCDICGETFVRIGAFKTHKRKHEYKII